MRAPLIGLGLILASPAWAMAATQQHPPVIQSPVNAPGTELPIEQTVLLAPLSRRPAPDSLSSQFI